MAPIGEWSVETVGRERQEMAIEAPLEPAWTKAEIKLLGTKSDRELAKLIGRSTAAVQAKRLL